MLRDRLRKRGGSSGQANHLREGLLISFRPRYTRRATCNDVNGQQRRLLFMMTHSGGEAHPSVKD